MGFEVRWAPYGREAAEALRTSIAAAKGEEPLAPVTVIVPSNHVGVASRRLLASGALGPVCQRGIGLAAVSFLTVYRLAELLGSARLAGSGRRPVSTPVVAAAMRAALAQHPGVFAAVAEHPTTEMALVSSYRELRDLSPGALRALAGAGARAADVVRLCGAAHASLASGWYDEEDLLISAVEVLRQEASAAAGLGQLIVHLPQRLSLHGASLLAAVAASSEAPVRVVAGTVGRVGADRAVVESLRRLGVPEVQLESETDGPADGALPVSSERTRIITASDADEEVRAAVRIIVDAVRAGTRLDRIAILHAGAGPYARLAHDQLSAAGIRANGPSVVPLAGRVAGRALLRVLALPVGGFRRSDLFSWMASAPVLADGRLAPVSRWEQISRDAGVVGGAAEWDERLLAHAESLEARANRVEAAEQPDTSRPVRSADSLRSTAVEARNLRTYVLTLIAELEVGAAHRPWGAHAAWARRTLHATLGGPGRRAAWPEVERKAAERVEVALDRLAAIDGVEGAVGLDVFTRTLTLELDADLARVGRFGEGVLVGSLSMAVGLDLHLVVVLGLAEGTLPAPRGDDSLLPDVERARAGGELELRRQALDDQHRQLLAALAGSTAQVLTVPRGDLRRSSERVASRWVLDVAAQLAGHRMWSEDLLAMKAPWLTHVASYDGGIRVATPATDQEHRLRAILASGAAGKGPAHLAAVAGDGRLMAGAHVVAGRKSATFTRFDGNLADCAVRSPAASTVSSTQLERWANCPFDYFTRYILGVEPVENPEDELAMTPLDRGLLVHAILERFIQHVLAQPVGEQPAPDDPWSPAYRQVLLTIAGEEFAEFERTGKTGRPVFWRRDRQQITADLGRILAKDDESRRLARTRPMAAELAFGGRRPNELPAVEMALPDGRTLSFRGKADRVDIAEDGTLLVVDYKTGSLDDYKTLTEDNPDERGRKLQLAVYGLAARLQPHVDRAAPVRAEYWFVSSKRQFRRIGYPVNDDVIDRVRASLAMIVDGIEGGVFPSYPPTDAKPWIECHACDPDGLGTVDLRHAWERKRESPALAAFVRLAEPLAAIVGEVEDGGGGPDA